MSIIGLQFSGRSLGPFSIKRKYFVGHQSALYITQGVVRSENITLSMDWNNGEEKTRSRSRSAHRRNHNVTSRRSRHKTNVKDTLRPDVPPRCCHLPPPPYRPAGPFALFFAAHSGGFEAKEVIYVKLQLTTIWAL